MKDKKKSRHSLMAVVAIIIVLAMVIGIVVPIFAAPYARNSVAYYDIAAVEEGEENEQTKIEKDDAAVSSESLEIKVEPGFDGVYMMYRQTPVKVTVYNTGEDFSGTVEVKSFISTETLYEPAVYTTYVQDADIANGGAGEYNFVIYPEASFTYMNVKLKDKAGNIVASVNAPVEPFAPEQVMTAVLTDTKSSNLDYLKGLKIGEDMYNNRAGYVTNHVAFLDESSMPEEEAVLTAFSAIIIDDFNTEALSEKQKGALLNWVEDGGLLVIGTGLNAEKTLKGLENILDFSLDGYRRANFFGGSTDIANMYIPDADDSDIEGGIALSKTVSLGGGKIIYHMFDLGLEPAASMSDKTEYFSHFYRNTMPDKFSSNRNYNYYYSAMDAVNRLPSIEKSSLMKLLGILALYIVIIGPICYIVLKKKDKRERGWVVIPIVAVVFSGIIFAASSTSYQKDARVSFMSYTDLNKPSPNTSVAIGLRSPQKGDISFGIDKNIAVLGNPYRYYDYSSAPDSVCMFSVKTADSKTEVTYFDKNAWESCTFNTNIDNMEEDCIDGSFTIKGSNLVATIKNNLDYDLFDIIVGFAGQYSKIGHIEAGGSADVTIPLSTEEQDAWMNDYYGKIRQLFFGLDEDEYQPSAVFKKGMSANEAYSIEQRFEILQAMANNNTSDLRLMSSNVSVAAFSEKPLIDGDKTINGKPVTENWENCYYKEFYLDINASESYNIPKGYVFPKEIVLNNDMDNPYWDMYYYQLYTMQSDNIICEYDLKYYNSLKEIDVDWENYDAFRGDTQVYNYADDAWQPLKEADLKNNVSDYISTDGRFRLMADVYSDTYINIPKISLKGGN